MKQWSIKIKDKTFSYDKKWLDLSQLYDDVIPFFEKLLLIFCVGDNSLGKTYSVENKFVNHMLSGKKCCWIRNTSAERNTCIDGWKEVFLDQKRNEKYFGNVKNIEQVFKVCDNGIYMLRTDDFGNFMLPTRLTKSLDEKYYKLMCPFVWAKNGDLSIPQIEPCELYCWDEVIPSNKAVVGTSGVDFTIKNPKLFLQKLMNRTNRNYENTTPTCFFLANPNVLESDVYTSFGVKHNWDDLCDGKDCIEVDYNRHIINLVFPRCDTWENDRLLIQKERNVIFNYGEETGVYNFLPSSMRTIYGHNEICDKLIEKEGYFINNEPFTIFECQNEKSDYLYYIKKKDWAEYWESFKDEKTKIPYYCFTAPDKRASINKAIYLSHNNDFARDKLKTFCNSIINNYPQFKYFIFDSLYTRTQFDAFIKNVECILLRVEEKDKL